MAGMYMPLPRIPLALARQQEAHPLKQIRKEPIPQILGKVINLRGMCAKWWVEHVQYILRRDVSKHKLFALQRFLSDIPRELRSYIVHNALKAGGLHLGDGSREIPAVNKALVFLSSDMLVHETVYITLTKPGLHGRDWSLDLDLLTMLGEGILKLVVTLPADFDDTVKRALTDLLRTCRHLTHVTIHQANDQALTIFSRYGQNIKYIDISGSEAVTDEGISLAVVNLKWAGNKEPSIKLFDVGKTSVTEEGVIQLMLRLPTLTSLGSTNVIEALGDLALMLDGESLTTGLEEITLKCATVNRLKALRRYCPKLHTIKVTFQENHGATINDLRLLPGLTGIDMKVCEPFLLSPSNLHDLAWSIGTKLLRLSISGDVFWEVDLGVLAGQCPFIQYLSLPAVTFLTKESLLTLTARDTPTLTHLIELEIDCMQGVGQKAWAKDYNLVRRGLVLALRRCKRLKRIVMRPTVLVDTDLNDILCENRLELLETLELYNSVLGLASAKLLVDTCLNLHVIKGIRTWRGMTLHELISLRQYGRGHRRLADLKILWF